MVAGEEKSAIEVFLQKWDAPTNTDNKVHAAIDLAELERPDFSINSTLFPAQCLERKLNDSRAEELLKKAVSLAQRLQDSRSESLALGKLGHLYECRKDYNKALTLTKQAQLAADQKVTFSMVAPSK